MQRIISCFQVGAIMRTAVQKIRRSNPGCKIGVCGEHGGDPKSIRFFVDLGLDYVSCSPFRIPIAKISAAQCHIEAVNRKWFTTPLYLQYISLHRISLHHTSALTLSFFSLLVSSLFVVGCFALGIWYRSYGLPGL